MNRIPELAKYAFNDNPQHWRLNSLDINGEVYIQSLNQLAVFLRSAFSSHYTPAHMENAAVCNLAVSGASHMQMK